jgi:hypothetical protein
MIFKGILSHHLSIPLREVTLLVTLLILSLFTLPALIPVTLSVPGPVTLLVYSPVSSRRTLSRSRSRSRSRYRSYPFVRQPLPHANRGVSLRYQA